jgi:Gas vesicle synthesis protein GvpO
MAERRKVRSGTGGRTSTRSRKPADRDEQELLEEAPEEDEVREADEPEDADDELLETDEPEDELLEPDEPEDADDELLEADEPEDELLEADEPEDADDELLETDEPEDADEDRGSPGNGRRRRPGRGGGSAMTASEAAQAALRQISQLTAKPPEGITQVARTEDGWAVAIELVEDQRIPSSSDILATYETTIDADGELLSYRRVRRYARGRGDTEEM